MQSMSVPVRYRSTILYVGKNAAHQISIPYTDRGCSRLDLSPDGTRDIQEQMGAKQELNNPIFTQKLTMLRKSLLINYVYHRILMCQYK